MASHRARKPRKSEQGPCDVVSDFKVFLKTVWGQRARREQGATAMVQVRMDGALEMGT